jgi:hypothetical protein
MLRWLYKAALASCPASTSMASLIADVIRVIGQCTETGDLASLMLLDKRWSAIVRPLLERRKRAQIICDFSRPFRHWSMDLDFRPYISMPSGV